MARNIRTIGIKGFTVSYAVNNRGMLEQHTGNFNTASPRKLERSIAENHGINTAEVMIINVEEYTRNYKILDIVKALEILKEQGLAVEVENTEPVEE